MPFKIVKTIEHGIEKLSIVPSAWESNNVLKWPRFRGERLMKNEFSTPKPDWVTMKCIVKRFNLKTFEAADKEVEKMVRHDNAYSSNTVTSTTSSSQERNTFAKPHTITSQSENIFFVCENENSSVQAGQTESSNTSMLSQILKTQKTLADNQILILNNQKAIMERLEEFSEEFHTAITNLTENVAVPDATSFASYRGVEDFRMEPIRTQEELENLEEYLSDPRNNDELKKKYSVVCSVGDGVTCAYKLLDIMFSREFLPYCSWSGSTRGDGNKICFKMFSNTINFFFQMIRTWDEKYSMEENENFFKCVLRNAKQRKLAKQMRASARKRRPRKQQELKGVEAVVLDDLCDNTDDVEEEGCSTLRDDNTLRQLKTILHFPNPQ